VESHVVGKLDGDFTFNVGNYVSLALQLHHGEVGLACVLLGCIEGTCRWAGIQPE
jgi:hypothetical protein